MSVLKFFGKIAVALIAVALTFLVIFLLTPGWQQSVVEEILDRDPARKWQVGSVAIGLTHVRAEEVFMLEGPVGVEMGGLHLKGPLWAGLLSGLFEINSGEVSDLYVDVSQLQVGDLTSQDWQGFLSRISGDLAFWEERVGLVLSKLAATGWHARIEDLEVSGQALMPGNRMVPVRFVILEADSREPGQVRLRELAERTRPEL